MVKATEDDNMYFDGVNRGEKWKKSIQEDLELKTRLNRSDRRAFVWVNVGFHLH